MDMNIETLVETQVRRELDHMDIRDIVESEVRKEIRTGMAKAVVAQVEAKADELVEREIENVLDGEVFTDDGWGKKNQYDSFEALFRATIKKLMDGTWEVKQTIERLVKQRCDSLIKQEYAQVCEKITDEITKSKLVKKK